MKQGPSGSGFSAKEERARWSWASVVVDCSMRARFAFYLRECFLPDLRSKGCDTASRRQRKEEVILVCDHPVQYGLQQRIIGIDQHVVSLKAIELERKVNDFKVGTAKQGVPEIKPDI